jgi:hypothetical protein
MSENRKPPSQKGPRLRFWQRVYHYVHRLDEWASDQEEEALLRDERYLASLPWGETVEPPLRWTPDVRINGEAAVYDRDKQAFVVAEKDPSGGTR